MYKLSKDEKEYYIKFLDTKLILDVEELYDEIIDLANKKEWNSHDTEILELLMDNDMGYFCQTIFEFKFKHPLYEIHYKYKNYAPNISEEEKEIIFGKLRNGTFKIQDIEKFAFKS